MTVMTFSNLFLEFSIVEYTKACKVSGVVYAVCLFEKGSVKRQSTTGHPNKRETYCLCVCVCVCVCVMTIIKKFISRAERQWINKAFVRFSVSSYLCVCVCVCVQTVSDM